MYTNVWFCFFLFMEHKVYKATESTQTRKYLKILWYAGKVDISVRHIFRNEGRNWKVDKVFLPHNTVGGAY